MNPITSVAHKFFEACETGKGWQVCSQYCKPEASFSAQAELLGEIRTLQQYTEWMKGSFEFMPDGRYEVKTFATDEERNSVCAYAVYSGMYPATGKSMNSDYVYVMEFEGDKIRHMTKIWNAGMAMKQLGWV